MTPLDRRTRARRRGFLLVAVLVVVGLAALGVRWGCDADETATVDSGEDVVSGEQAVVKVGDPVKLGGTEVIVTAFTPTEHPVRPTYPVDASVQPSEAGSGETYYQAFVRLENGGKGTFRFDPADFDLLVGSTPVGMDPTYSGPTALTLLPGATLDAIVSFRAPTGADVKLRYRPVRTGATIIFTGTRKPEGMAGVTVRAQAG